MSKTKQPASECVKVMVRVRPMNALEASKGCENVVSVESNELSLRQTGSSKEVPKTFSFDAVFGMESKQRTVYEEAAFPLVESVLEGYNGTIFAYGQTGSGKTHTMVGLNDDASKGIIPNAFDHVFGSISSIGESKRFLIRCSYIEIYNEAIHDLLDYSPDAKLELKETPQKGTFIKDLSTVVVRSAADTRRTMDKGAANRHIAETMMNKTSSRSHTIFTVYIETMESDSAVVKAGKLNLVDLAGSERQSKTKAEGERLKEATKINLSLSALGNVISALVDGKSSHVPYRDSKLTRLLQDSLGGNTKTVMIACISPAVFNYEETLSTLRYASRAKFIKNKPRINEDPKDALLKEYEGEIKQLKELLEKLSKGVDVGEKVKTIANRKSFVKYPEEIGSHGNSEIEEGLRRDREQAEIELMEKQRQIFSEKEQKEKLEAMIKETEKKVLIGGQKLEQWNREQARKYEQMKQQFKIQRAKQKKLLEQHRIKQEEVEHAQQKYESIQDELDDKNNAIRKLRKRIAESSEEIEDIRCEHQAEKENILGLVREQNEELEFLRSLVEIIMTEEEVGLVKEKAEWDSEGEKWFIPEFSLQSKELALPMLSTKGQANPYAEEVKDDGDNGTILFNNYPKAPIYQLQNYQKAISKKSSSLKRPEPISENTRDERDMPRWNIAAKIAKNLNESRLKASLKKTSNLDLPSNEADQISPILEESLTFEHSNSSAKLFIRPPKRTAAVARPDETLQVNAAKRHNPSMQVNKEWNPSATSIIRKLKPILRINKKSKE